MNLLRHLGVVMVLASASAFSEAEVQATASDGGSAAIEPRLVNPGSADAPSQLIRDPMIADSLETTGELDARDGGAGARVAEIGAEIVTESEMISDGGSIDRAFAMPAVGDTVLSDTVPSKDKSAYTFRAELSASIRLSYQGATAFPIDSNLTTTKPAPLMSRVRASPGIYFGPFGAVVEADVATGALFGAPATDLVGSRVPFPTVAALDMRKAYLEYKWQAGMFRAGLMTSHWGLGLLANDGARDPGPGDFGQQQFGNLTYRALLGVRPLAGRGGRFRNFETAIAADLIVRDNNAEFANGDRAFQGVLALRYVKDEQHQIGVYGVYRAQRKVDDTTGGGQIDVGVINVSGSWEFKRWNGRSLSIGFEAVTIHGTTTTARNENASVLAVHSYGAAAKLKYKLGKLGVLFDAGFASGDQNPQDDQYQAFRFDRDFKVGLILFDQVLAYQTARSSVRAQDPSLLGVPAEGSDLLGTGGGVSGAWYLFPRVVVPFGDWIDSYGGVLFAFPTAKLTDAFATRLNGGVATNALGARPGGFFGAELDLGLQARFQPAKQLKFTITGEGGIFLPGSAFTLPSGALMNPVGFGRARLVLAL